MFDDTNRRVLRSTVTERDIAVAAAISIAMEFYGCDAVTAAARRAICERDEHCDLQRYAFWRDVFKSLKTGPSTVTLTRTGADCETPRSQAGPD